MKQPFVILLIALIFGCATTGAAPRPDANPAQPKRPEIRVASPAGGEISMRVLWTISEYRLGANARWKAEEARRMLFKPLDIDANSITFDGKSCHNISFKKQTVKTKEYLKKSFHITPQILNIKEEAIEVIKTNCNLPGFGEYMRLKDRRLVIQMQGVFFFFEPAVNY